MVLTGAEIERLFRHHGSRLQRIVETGTSVPQATAEDACQAAWGRLLDRASGLGREAALSWLAITATREAARLERHAQWACSLEDAIEAGGEGVVALAGPSPDERLEPLERLRGLSRLPLRQQRLLWLQGIGFSYGEMAAHEGCTRRTVERQLLRAQQRARAA